MLGASSESWNHGRAVWVGLGLENRRKGNTLISAALSVFYPYSHPSIFQAWYNQASMGNVVYKDVMSKDVARKVGSIGQQTSDQAIESAHRWWLMGSCHSEILWILSALTCTTPLLWHCWGYNGAGHTVYTHSACSVPTLLGIISCSNFFFSIFPRVLWSK